ncbi:MAG: class I tRNA ligase family protein [Candidatus Pacebacteria bacterium]|nr:class I tRNA ligase family protein [Candidatus Paceibacterota bacterium]
MEENKEKTTEKEMGHKKTPLGMKKSAIALREEEVLRFWQENKIFEKSQTGKEHLEEFVFYDGPPFATGLPHYGHILTGTLKDAIPRYQTMKGKRVARRWGWDCHGLPMENIVEKELGLKTKKDIEILGIKTFNETARKGVLRYADDWKKIIPRLGRWIDMENAYRTMDASYSETVWWIFKTLFDKKLIYKGFKSMHICPRCETTLSNFEVNQGYKDVTDISVTAEFELTEKPKTFILAWTTTPWTLPGNAALAINPKTEYVAVEGEEPGNTYILAKSRVETVFKSGYKILRKVEAKELLGKSYKPLFDYYVGAAKLENKENAWKIYAGDFVTTEDGTGVVHIAPAFGTDDYNLSRKENLPFIQHVGMDGKFKKEVTDFAGQLVKPKEDPQKTDIEIIKNLAHRGLLFAKEKIIHSYPHCWRCETPLLNYATSSWFVKVTEIKEKLVSENRKVNWVPEDLRDGRFGKWLEGAPDWAISRSRFWGAPLPVWECNKCEKREVIGSIEKLREKSSRKNNYFLVRHGEAESNLTGTVSCRPDDPYKLTEKGRKEVEATAKLLKKKKIDVIFVSDYVRTKETAEIIREALNISPDKVIIDIRLREDNIGVYQGKTWKEYQDEYPYLERFVKTPEGGETLAEVRKRSGDFLFDIDSRFSGKNILIVSHDTPMTLVVAAAGGWTKERILLGHERKTPEPFYFQPAELREISFSPYPHNDDYELDLHRPYIDEVTFPCDCCPGEMKRIPEVFDCWFESGSMPYGQFSYQGEALKDFNPKKSVGFPADFIAEGLDQTRGWFYSLIVLGVALFGKSPFKNVLVNGLVLAEDGRKMSKSLQNYPDPLDVVNVYGADALRFYLLSSPVTHAEDLNFTEKGVDEVMKKIIMRLENVLSFYELYKGGYNDVPKDPSTSHSLDQWVVSRLNELVFEVEKGMEAYELDRACRPLLGFVDDLSTWYLRRSRDRFKGDDTEDKMSALKSTQYVLFKLSKIIAPIMPFLSETIYGRVKGSGGKESVHLEMWPKKEKIDSKLLKEMEGVRNLVSLGLEARSKALIKVRQPLAKITVKAEKISPELVGLIKDELNVKEVIFDAKLSSNVLLDTTITPVLKEEGEYRELIRVIQDFRKEKKLQASDKVSLSLTAPKEILAIVKKFEAEIKKVCNITGFETREGEFELKL